MLCPSIIVLRALDGDLMSVILYGPSWHSKPKPICSPGARVLGSHKTVVLSELEFCGWMLIFSTVRFKARSSQTDKRRFQRKLSSARTCVRIKVKYNGLSVVDARNIVPTGVADTCPISYSEKSESDNL
jgi:hypothetical protein